MSRIEKAIIAKAKRIVGDLPAFATEGDRRATLAQRFRLNEHEIKAILKKLKS